MNPFRTSSTLVGLLLVTAWMGCGGDDPATPPTSPSSGGAAGTAGGVGGGGGRAGSTGASAGSSGAASVGGSSGAGGTSTAGAGGAGAGASGAGSGGCTAAADCVLPETNPVGCVEAACTAGECTYLARDADGDGFRRNKCKVVSDQPVVIELGNDCDDTDPGTNPKGWDAPEGDGHPSGCNDGIDQDCSGADSDGTLANGTSCACTVGDVAACSVDGGGKVVVFPGGEPVGRCQRGSWTCGLTTGTGAASFGPCVGTVGPAPEECNGEDDDCDGEVDEDAFDQKTWRCDGDGDGHLDATKPVLQVKSCLTPPTNEPTGPDQVTCNGLWVLTGQADDCNDADAAVFPGNTEACDGKDNDCDLAIDEDVTNVVWVRDVDGDGFGAIGSESAPSCAPPDATPGWKSGIPATDCDDTRKTVSPLGLEVCDGFDNNCASGVDEGTTCDDTVTLTAVAAGDLQVKLTKAISKTGGSTDPYFDDYPLGIYGRIAWSVVDPNTVRLTQTLVEAKTTSGGDSTVGQGTGTADFTVDKAVAAVLSGSGASCSETVGSIPALCKWNEFPSAGTIGAPTGVFYVPAGEPYKVTYKCIAQSGFAPKGGVCGGSVTQCNSCDFSYAGKLNVKRLPYLPAPL
jgi:hypothetical protein